MRRRNVIVALLAAMFIVGVVAAGDDLVTDAERLLQKAIGETKKDVRATQLTDELAGQAAALLDHEDPFVRGIAEWAIAIRVGMDNDARKYWPRPNPPAWFTRWSALKPSALLDFDYVRQCVALGQHSSRETLLVSADAVVKQSPQPEALRAARDRVAAATDITAQRKAWLTLRHAARDRVLANLDFTNIVFITRYSCIGAHNLASYSYHQDSFRPGGDVVVQAGLAPDAPMRPVLGGQLGPGSLRGMDLWWDADKVVVAFSKQPDGPDGEPTHIYEVNLDGTGLRQLTDDKKWIDTEPTYLADGSVVFGSDRAGIGSECGSWEQNAGTLNLYRVSADGKQIERLTFNKDYDRYPHSLDNGLIAFLRWDYAERQFFSCHSIWTVRPDGTMADALYKSHVQASPYSLRDARSIPHSDKLVAIACGHHNLAEGAVTIVNPTAGVNNPSGMRYVTPAVGNTEGGYGKVPAVAEGGVRDKGGKYQTPWALSERSFLVSYAYEHPASSSFGIYYIDVAGNKELLHRDRILESAYPMPVRKRTRPPVIPETTKPDMDHAVCYVSDVYSDMPGVARGTVKHLRIAERVNWVFDKSPRGELRWVPGNPFSPQFGYWTWAPVRVIGIVPVGADGSAYFQVPAGMAVYFQALDENFMEVRRMRSHIAFQPGEVRGCVGCHESKAKVDALKQQITQAARQSPATPVPPPWGDRALLDYEKLIQPILDRRCVGCHGGKEPKAGLDLTATPDAYGFAQSYRSMFGLKPGQPTPVSDGDGWYRRHYPSQPPHEDKDWYRLVLENKAPGQLVAISDRTTSPWQKPIDAGISQPKQFGSHQSKLILTLLNTERHKKDVKLTPDEWLTLVTWVDANAPYAATFFQKFAEDGSKVARPQRVHLELPPPFPKEK